MCKKHCSSHDLYAHTCAQLRGNIAWHPPIHLPTHPPTPPSTYPPTSSLARTPYYCHSFSAILPRLSSIQRLLRCAVYSLSINDVHRDRQDCIPSLERRSELQMRSEAFHFFEFYDRNFSA